MAKKLNDSKTIEAIFKLEFDTRLRLQEILDKRGLTFSEFMRNLIEIELNKEVIESGAK